MNAKQVFTTALLAIALTAARASASDLWLHVKVHDAKEDSHVNINLPLSMVQKSAAFIPSDAKGSGRIRINDKDMDVAELRRMWDEVRNQPDATFVTVDDKDSKVRIAKQGEYLRIFAHDRQKGRGEEVEMRIPLEVVSALLSGKGDEMNVGAAIQALARRGAGELVTVNGDDETVRIWVDAQAETR